MLGSLLKLASSTSQIWMDASYFGDESNPKVHSYRKKCVVKAITMRSGDVSRKSLFFEQGVFSKDEIQNF